MSNDNKRLIKTIIISGLSAVISYLINFFLTSYISENVGIDAYGFVAIAKTAVSYAQIITVALTTFIVRYISISYHRGEMEKANSYYSSSVMACVTLSGIIRLPVNPRQLVNAPSPILVTLFPIFKVPLNL